MCSGSKRKPSQTGLIMGDEHGRQEGLHHKISALLEFSAADDLTSFKDAVEKEGHDVDEVGLWYGRRVGSKELRFEERTPLMIAAMFGGKSVLSYILGTGRVDVNRACGSDGATALHCAVAGGSSASLEVIKLLLNASVDVGTVDANGNRSCDLIFSVSNGVLNSRKRIPQAILEGADGIDKDCLRFEEVVGQMEKQQQQDVDALRVSKDGTEKKDYPVDPSLPDIKNGIYSSDEFRMYTFKVRPCSRAYSHDWTECPFVHPGENARRRDPRRYQYSCVPCPEFRKGSCSKGDACDYAHGIFECYLHPAQYKTRLCKETGCTRRVCFFAHNVEDLRPTYASTGSAMPSSRSYSVSSPPLDPFTLGSPSALIPPASTPPLTPSGGSSPAGGTMWHSQSHVAVPILQLPQRRLKSALNARDIELDMELLGIENHRRLMQQLMMEEMAGLSSPSNWNNSMPNSPSLCDYTGNFNRLSGVQPTNLEDVFGSQIQSPARIQVHQNVNQQLRDYPSNLYNSSVIGSPSFRVDPSGAAAAMALNPRNAAFANRSQSFIEPNMVNGDTEFPSPATSTAAKPSTFSGWGPSDGKLDWSIHGDELKKPSKSSSVGFLKQQ